MQLNVLSADKMKAWGFNRTVLKYSMKEKGLIFFCSKEIKLIFASKYT